jgi:FtsP/CotA-like multicopper oxidase with cupredoxin domain
VIYSDTRDKRTGQKFAVDLLLARASVVFLGMMTLFLSATSAQSPHLNGHGAMSAQDIQKIVVGPLSSSSSTGACPDLAAGSTITAPTDLYSQNGVLEVTLNLQTDVDAAGRQRYCYVTNTGLVSPNLRVNPGDTLLIHFYNQLPAGLIPVVPQVMPSMPGMDSMSHGLTNGMAAGMRVILHGTPQAGAYPSITVAMDFRDPNIVGTFVYHCHILQHEDAGMMGVACPSF